LFGVGLCGCGPSPQAAFEALPKNRASTAPTTPVHEDDPKTCLSATESAEAAWRKAVQKKLDEKLSSLGQCISAGNVTREGRFLVNTSFSSSGTWQALTGAITTLPDCRAIDCIEKQLSSVRVDAWPEAKTPIVSFEFVLSPNAPPRHSSKGDPTFNLKEVARCADDPTDENGRLPLEVIQKVVLEASPNVRACYEDGLGRNPNLKGTIVVRLIIERDGSVARVSLDDVTLPDCKVAACVRETVPKLSFPAPEGGPVTVIYPIRFKVKR
jgi:hypothetical protein